MSEEARRVELLEDRMDDVQSNGDVSWVRYTATIRVPHNIEVKYALMRAIRKAVEEFYG